MLREGAAAHDGGCARQDVWQYMEGCREAGAAVLGADPTLSPLTCFSQPWVWTLNLRVTQKGWD